MTSEPVGIRPGVEVAPRPPARGSSPRRFVRRREIARPLDSYPWEQLHKTPADRAFEATVARVAETFDVTLEELVGPSRTARIAWPRHVLCYLLRASGGEFQEIGRRIGRDDSTVHHSVTVVTRRLRVSVVDRELVRSIAPEAVDSKADDDAAAELAELVAACRVIESQAKKTAALLNGLEAQARAIGEALEKRRGS
ncbi:Chromosomal replication initiator, DnaA C-terminal [uncultured Caudovirales phage]|uniref:Chromosomal replication initiator, DnaA C-terminal n=1 Tax=uncultured Caudovirales phage TaxID=2100421 RepID=A0A6J5QEQ0_9CAUD|nr:Chromosomal replication initiator, DnaA C-terminal [uncultured Caudovirales phage]CAB4173314.1 Chromosomal replication initiator, DnaA C-terminal [uncultured Caudovirales phage]CAB4179595.1 Chromosomal replication initiator, DnaA C-terminal [uncultured Caudovirales phage]CAB4203876.1 Chromosomal replication initiator, DnaA C-terminal [uncultured Caudovirales phage]CAB4215982.1 Chromosomal replication initiator, DnaA C-terminal [uncultured Caudovirales phage]